MTGVDIPLVGTESLNSADLKKKVPNIFLHNHLCTNESEVWQQTLSPECLGYLGSSFRESAEQI